MGKPLVSVICACYNQSKYLIESLESVKAQTYKNIEIIIWDDASKDDSVEKIENWISQNSYLDIRFVKHSENKGICKSLNECFLLSTGKYIQLLALDDILLNEKIDRHVSILEKSSNNQALVFSDAYIIDENSSRYQNRFIARYKNYLSINTGNFWNDLLNGNFIPAMSVLLKREIIQDIGLWDEALPYEDYDMWLRISKKYDFIYDEIPSVEYRLHGENTHLIKGVDGDIWFRMFIKHIENQDVAELIRNHIKCKYLNHESVNGLEIYFSKYPPDGILEKFIYYRFPLTIYNFIKKFY